MQEIGYAKNNKNIIGLLKRPETPTLIILIVMVTIVAMLQENFFEAKNFVRTVNAYAPLMMMAIGQAVVLISGGLDLSAGSTLSFMACLMVSVMRKDDPTTGAIALLLGVGSIFFVGCINGIGVGYLRLPPVIITFATSFMWRGLSLFLRPIPGGETAEWFKVFYKYGDVSGVGEATNNLSQIIPPSLILLISVCLIWFFISRTKTGRYFYAVGSHEESAFQSGINTAKVKMMAYIFNATCIFFAALFFVAQNRTADANLGEPFTLSVIAAPVLGGIALLGGKGNVYFAMVGALILSFTSKIIFYGDISSSYQTLINGMIIILALCLSTIYMIRNKSALPKENG